MGRLITREIAKSKVLDTIGGIIDELSEKTAPKNVFFDSKMLKIVVSEDEIRLIVDESDPIPFKFTPLRKGDLVEFRPDSHKNDPNGPVTRYDSSVKYGVYVAPGKFAASDAEMSNPVDGEPVTKLGINVLDEEAAAPEMPVAQSPATYLQQVGRAGSRSTLDELKIKEDGLPLEVKLVEEIQWTCPECDGPEFEGNVPHKTCAKCGYVSLPWECQICGNTNYDSSEKGETDKGRPVITCSDCCGLSLIDEGISIKRKPQLKSGTPPKENHGIKYQQQRVKDVREND